MILNNDDFKLDVTSEIGDLRVLLIHSPDSGLGKVVPSKAQDWLFEDIVHTLIPCAEKSTTTMLNY
jgi:arginine deiminase